MHVLHDPRIELTSRPIDAAAGGSYRMCPPADSYARLERLVAAGIVPPVVCADQATHIYVCRGAISAAMGKGRESLQARVSCLAEAVERASAVFRGDEPRTRTRLADLGGHAVDPGAILNFSPRQYETRDAWNRVNPGVHWVPEPVDTRQAIDWTPCWSLTRQQTRYLPTAYCYIEYAWNGAPAFCFGDSNGCAAGNCIEDAILEGFFELVERDATALFWYSRARRPAVALDVLRDPFVDWMRDHYRARERTLAVLDMTTDLGIPAVAGVSWTREGGRILIGLGAHLDPRLAIARALGELNQMLLIDDWCQRRDDGPCPPVDPVARHWLATAMIDDHPFLVPDEREAPTQTKRREHSGDLREEIRVCEEIARTRGLEILVRDLTRQEIGVPVVRVVVPGLRHFWARFGVGRLYDVPLRLGWIDSPIDERDLNPIPFPL